MKLAEILKNDDNRTEQKINDTRVLFSIKKIRDALLKSRLDTGKLSELTRNAEA